jgi:23S rRNA pseudouridine1911/1915/1917 synthase
MFLVRDRALNKRVSEEVAAHRVQRRYLAVVGKSQRSAVALPDRGALRQRLLAHKGGASTVVSNGGQQAVTHFEVVERSSSRALVQLVLETGRKHQIRAQLSHAGYPVVGDELYGGEPASRSMLLTLLTLCVVAWPGVARQL